MYCTTVSLLPTHQQSTNRVVARNRRIGVSAIDIAGWKHTHGVHKITQWLRKGYEKVVKVACESNDTAGIPRPIRFTTVKPGGTGPKLPGLTPGMGSPTFRYTLRRIRIAKNSPIHPLLVKANIPHEEDRFDKYTDCFEYPILQGPSPPAEEVSLWEQGMNLILVQREWADNAVSNTLYFRPMWPLTEKVDADFRERLEYHLGVVAASQILCTLTKEYIIPERYKINISRDVNGGITEIKIHEYNPHHEENHVEPVLSAIAPLTKSVSVLPHSAKGVYIQTPEEGLTEEEYYARLATIRKVDWQALRGSDGQDELYCTKETCEVPRK
jgi:hypothetical protein